MSNFFNIIKNLDFYNEVSRIAKRICNAKSLKGQWDLDVYEPSDLVAIVYEKVIESYQKDNEKYTQLNKSELLAWFVTTLRGTAIDQVRKMYSKKITTDRIHKSKNKDEIFAEEIKAETKKRVEWMELDNELKTGTKKGSSKIPVLGMNIEENVYERNLTLVQSMRSRKLSEKCREILELFLEHYSMSDISEKIKMPVNSVKSRLSNCRQELVDISGL
jgi:RNA polymerase sigma factor (sigma-70 family)